MASFRLLTGTQSSQTYCVGASSEASTPCFPKGYCTNNEHEDKHVKLYGRLHRQGIFDLTHSAALGDPTQTLSKQEQLSN